MAVEALLRSLEARLNNAPCLGGDSPCATDLAVMPFVRQFAAVDPDWFETLELPSVRSWLNGWLANPLFVACMHKWSGYSTIFPRYKNSAIEVQIG